MGQSFIVRRQNAINMAYYIIIIQIIIICYCYYCYYFYYYYLLLCMRYAGLTIRVQYNTSYVYRLVAPGEVGSD